MRIVAALVLLVHGVSHLVGFVVPWRLATLPEVPSAHVPALVWAAG
jgi:hypothetical protein